MPVLATECINVFKKSEMSILHTVKRFGLIWFKNKFYFNSLSNLTRILQKIDGVSMAF